MRSLLPTRLRLAVWALLPGLILPTTFLTLAAGPWSPWALDRADALSLQGDPDAALAAYDRVERWSLSETARAQALLRAGLLAAAEADRPQRAVRLLRRFIEEHPGDPAVPDAQARLAAVLSADLNRPAQAAAAYTRAADMGRAHPEAGRWLLEAAALQESAGATAQAWRTCERVTREHPELAVNAWLRMARLRLVEGDAAGAQELYERVLARDEVDAGQRKLAQLGLSISLEDLGEFEAAAAVAELDPTAPDAALVRRSERVRGRSEARGR